MQKYIRSIRRFKHDYYVINKSLSLIRIGTKYEIEDSKSLVSLLTENTLGMPISKKQTKNAFILENILMLCILWLINTFRYPSFDELKYFIMDERWDAPEQILLYMVQCNVIEKYSSVEIQSWASEWKDTFFSSLSSDDVRNSFQLISILFTDIATIECI